MKKAILLLIVFQIIIIGVLLYKIYRVTSLKKVASVTNVAPINKKSLVFPADSGFKFYNTLVPSVPFDDTRQWDHTVAHYTINADGLNERYDYSIVKADGVFRIMTLGDSFTFGHFVDTKDNWTEKLEDELNQHNACTNIKKFEVINLGMRGFDIPYIVKRFTDIGAKYHPDLIIWFESGTGFFRNEELAQPLIQKCVEQNSETIENATPEYSKKIQKCWDDAYSQISKKYTSEAVQRDFNNWISKFLFVRGHTPTLFAAFSNNGLLERNILQDRVKNQENAFVFTDITDITQKNGIFPDGHPNKTGHMMIAKDIFGYITDKAITRIPCE